jgi:hypothetical protein
MIRLIAWVLLAAFVAGCRPAPRETDACLAGREALSQILEMNADRRITMLTAVTIDSRAESLTSQLEAKAGDSDPRFTFGWKKVGADGFQPADVLPTPDLAQSFLDTAPVSLTTCDGVRAEAESARVVVAEPSKAGSLPEGVNFATVMATKPVVSQDGRQAVVYVSQRSGSLDGAGYLLLFRKDGSEWRAVSSAFLWLS